MGWGRWSGYRDSTRDEVAGSRENRNEAWGRQTPSETLSNSMDQSPLWQTAAQLVKRNCSPVLKLYFHYRVHKKPCLLWASTSAIQIQSTPPNRNLRWILMFSSHNFKRSSLVSNACYIHPSPLHPPWLATLIAHRWLNNVKIFITQLSPTPNYFIRLGPNIQFSIALSNALSQSLSYCSFHPLYKIYKSLQSQQMNSSNIKYFTLN